jgi:DNA-binding beta-propeller fold protein YncE
MRLFFMNSGHTRLRLIQACAVVGVVSLFAGCGNNYRPVITPVNSNGPGAQPQSYAVVVSAPSPTTPGIATIIDYSGDSVLAYAPIGPGPSAFTIDETGSNGYTLNSDGTLSNFPISTQLQQKQVSFSTLSNGAAPVNLFSPSSSLWATDLTGNVVDFFQGVPEAFKLAIPLAPAFTPITVVGPGLVAERNYIVSQNIPGTSPYPAGVACNISPTTGPIGTATAIETSTFTVSANIPLGKCPVYAVQNNDNRRLFVINRGSDTITVINSQLNTLDRCTPFVNQSGQTVTCHPTLPLSLSAVAATGITPPNGTSGMTAIAGPVYAEFNAMTSQLVVANYDGNTITVIDVSEDEYGNDSSTFGTTYTIPVGKNPASVTVLADGSRAYTANQTDQTVSIVNLSSHTVEKTALPVIGHPRTVVSTQNSEYSKVYVASPDSPYLTIVESTPTVTDIVDTTVLVEGNIVDVRVSTQTGSSGNTNSVSRVPGYGQPCNLPPTPSNPTPAPSGTQTLLQACQAIP